MKTWRKLHRWTGLFLVGLVGFYCITGILLNHRQDFDYFQEKENRVVSVPISDPALLRAMIETYKKQIKRSDDPAVIRIRGGETIEFLYGSHGKTTYIIKPGEGTMEMVEKRDQQPWTRLNNLHKAFKTTTPWLVLADAVAVGVFFLGLSGLLLFRFKPLDAGLLIGGAVVLAVSLFFG